MKSSIQSISKSMLFISAALLLGIGFQNCSDVQFASSNQDPVGKVCVPGTNIDDPDCDNNGQPPDVPPENGRVVLREQTVNVDPTTNKADILFIIDNSGSMNPQLAALADKFPNFIASLANLDWQICATTTSAGVSGARNGALLSFSNGSTVLKKSDAEATTMFRDMLASPSLRDQSSGDERGIMALNLTLANHQASPSNCFRTGASLNTVVISDEDERSTGGYDQFINNTQYRPLEPLDQPNSVFTTLAATFPGMNKLYTHHSIIIKPDDMTCWQTQNTEAGGGPAFYGTHYARLTELTKGVLGSVCEADYGIQLSFIAQRIESSLASVGLICSPVDAKGDPVTVASLIILSIVPSFSTTPELHGNRLTFTPVLPASTTLRLRYYCRE